MNKNAAVGTDMGNLTGGRLLARNTVWNLGASIASILISLLSVPILLRCLGADRFGVISLVWIIEGQFSIFDLGLGPALTKLVSARLGISKEDEIPAIFWSSMLIMSIVGVVAAILLRVASPWLVLSLLRVPAAIQQETITAFHLVAFSLPVVISSGGMRGLIAAYQRFDLISAVRVPLSLFCYLVPLLVLPFSHELGPFIFVLVAARFLGWLLMLVLCLRVVPILRHKVTVTGAPLSEMLRFGSWMTVTNIVSPIMVNLDRLLIGALISMAAVAYYATPYEAVTRLWIIPSAITTVLFPAFSTALAQDRSRAVLLFQRALKYLFISLFPIVVAALTLGPLALRLWLGVAFAEQSITVLRLLAVGIFANSLAQVPFWHIQAANRPDLAAKAHLVELPCYLLIFWLLTTAYGITGAGLAALLRSTIDALIMFWLSGRLLREVRHYFRGLIWAAAAAALLFSAAGMINNMSAALTFTIAVDGAFLWITWKLMLNREEQQFVRNPMSLVSRSSWPQPVAIH